MLDFPASPTLNQQFSSGTSTWQWDGTAWNVVPQMTPAVASDTPPLNPAIGQGWWRGTNGKYYLWLDDGNSKQWVEIGNAGATPGAWETVFSGPFSSATGTFAVPNLAPFRRIRFGGDITTSTLGGLNWRVSTDNGATWVGGASDYYTILMSAYAGNYGVAAGTTLANSAVIGGSLDAGSNAWFSGELESFNTPSKGVPGFTRFGGLNGGVVYYRNQTHTTAQVIAANALMILMTNVSTITGFPLTVEGVRG